MSSFSVTVKLCKDPDTGSPWLQVPHVSFRCFCAPALCFLTHTLVSVLKWAGSHQATEISTKIALDPFAGRQSHCCPPPCTPSTGMGSQLYNILCPGSLGTFADTFYSKKTPNHLNEIQINHYHITWYWREKSSKLFLFTSAYQFRQLQNWKILPLHCSFFSSFLLLGMWVKQLS